jgi:hypothetical protein
MLRSTLFAILLIIFICRCSDQKKEPASTTDKTGTTSSTTTTAIPAVNSPNDANGETGGVVGNWTLHLDAFDENNNQQLDPEERAKAISNRMTYQFKADGSCVIQGILKGRYELKKKDGKDHLVVYRQRIPQEEDEDPLPDEYRILSVAASELVLLMWESFSASTIWVFKKV